MWSLEYKIKSSMVATKVMLVSHLSLQVDLGSTGEEKLHSISMTIATGIHESSPVSLGKKHPVMKIITRSTYAYDASRRSKRHAWIGAWCRCQVLLV